MGSLYHQPPTLPAGGCQTQKWEVFSMVWEMGGGSFLDGADSLVPLHSDLIDCLIPLSTFLIS